jgi:hypothetical protein
MCAVMSPGHGFVESPFALGHERLADADADADANAAVTRLRRPGLHAW